MTAIITPIDNGMYLTKNIVNNPKITKDKPTIDIRIKYPISSIIVTLPYLLARFIIVLTTSLAIKCKSAKGDMSCSIAPMSISIIEIPKTSASITIPTSTP